MRNVLVLGLLVGLAVSVALADEPPLLQADQPVTAGWRLQSGALELSLALTTRTTLTVACPLRPGLVEINGLREPGQFTYDPGSRRLTITLGSGHYQLRLREWTKP